MKNKILLCALCGVVAVSLTGCGNAEEKIGKSINLEKGAFSIVCTNSDDSNGMKIKNETTYYFNDEQYTINYKVVTTQKFKDKSTYETYKKEQEDTVKSSSDSLIYSLKSNDKTKTLIFTMAVTDIDYNNAESEEEKDTLKASSILKKNEESAESTSTCEVKGIERSELK